MKLFKTIALAIFTIYSAVAIISCKEDVKGNSTFYGKVVSTPSSAKIGEEIKLSIGPGESGYAGISSSTLINGKNVVKSISYCIDGVEIAKSSDDKNNYSASYVVKGLSLGSHEITAHCNKNFKDFEIDEQIKPATFVVEE